MKKILFSLARPKDFKDIKALLRKVGLPVKDVSFQKQSFVLARNGSGLAGCVGLEAFGQEGLLRSLAVDKPFRNRSLARSLYERLLTQARTRGIKRLTLLTTTAAPLFKKWGFVQIPRHKAPRFVQTSQEFSALCPESASCLSRGIHREVNYYPKDLLRLRPDVPGSQMWGIALEKAMLTYFEVKPRCRFKRHHHESEQITWVLRGELFFEMDDKTIRLEAGEAISVPSNVPHAVFTKGKGAKAVDAWSPVMPLYES